MMIETIHGTGPVFAIFKEESPYLKARKDIEWLSQDYGLYVADMPTIVKAVVSQPSVLAKTRTKSVDSTTIEWRGYRNGKRYYELWHGIGSLDDMESFDSSGGRIVNDFEWEDAGDGKYMLMDVPRVHLDDARNGGVPKPGTPYIIFVRPDTDDPVLIEKTKLDRLTRADMHLNYDEFMRDDSTLMIAGNPENRENLAEILFMENGLGLHTHYLRADSSQWREGAAIRTPLSFGGSMLDSMYGFRPSEVNSNGRFLAVSEQLIGNGTAPGIRVPPTLEEVVKVVEDNNKGFWTANTMLRDLEKLYVQ